jgi:hypothetical protein
MGASESLMIVDRINDAKFIYLSPSNYLADDLGK